MHRLRPLRSPASGRAAARARHARRFALEPWPDFLEKRLAPAGTITITSVSVDSLTNQPLSTVSVGESVELQTNFTTQGLPSNAGYYIEDTINGGTKFFPEYTYGAGVSGTPSYTQYWSSWLPTPGTNLVTVTIVPIQGVTGTSYSFAFTAVSPAVGNVSYEAAQIRTAYGIDSIPDFGSATPDGTGQTIAIVEAYNNHNIVADLDAWDERTSATFSFTPTLFQQYGSASSFFNVYSESGTNITSQIAASGVGAVPPAGPAGSDFGLWEDIDVQWAHAIAPGAKIDLIECTSGSTADLDAGVATAANLPGVTVVLMRGGVAESSSETKQDSLFETPSGHPGVTFVTMAGDAPGNYPAFSPNVLAVGGTQLALNSNAYAGETGSSFPTPVVTVTSGSSGYSQTGSWTSQKGGFSGTYSTASAGSSSTATWTTSITSADENGGEVEVSATWVGNAADATNATYKIYDGTAATGTLLGTVPVNQTKSSAGTADGNSQFQELGIFDPTSGKLAVVLSASSANGTVVADAIGIAPDSANGGGQSQFEAEPSYQLSVQSSGFRTIPDVSINGSAAVGVTVWTGGGGGGIGYIFPGGTGVAAACWAGLIAIANQGRVANGGTSFNSPSNPQQTLQALYSQPAGDFNAITTGYNGNLAGPGYNEVAGLGTPIANLLIPALAGYQIPTQLAITAAPPASVAAGSGFSLSVAVEDPLGNVITSFSGSVTLGLQTNPGSGTLSGTLTANVVNGVATFNGLTLNAAGAGYTLMASSGTLTPAVSSAITVTPGSGLKLAVTTEPPSSVTAGAGLGVAVTVEDQFGNVVSNYTGTVTLALATNPGGTSLGGKLTATVSAGVATFTGLTLNVADPGYTLTATSPNVTSATSTAITVTPAGVTKLAIKAEPPGAVDEGQGFGLAVAAEDQFGNVVSTYTGSVALALQTNPGGAMLSGIVTVPVASGVATFSGLTLNLSGNGYVIQATSGSLTPALTTAIAVISQVAPSSVLVMTTEPPSTVTAGSGFTVVVSAENVGGTVDPTFNGTVTLALETNPGNTTLGGTLTATASAGVVAFSGLTLDVTDPGYTLIASVGNLTPGISTAIAVTSGSAVTLAVTSEPPSSVAAGAPFGFSLAAEDRFGNINASYNGTVALALDNNPGRGILGGTLTATASAGLATFTGLTLDSAGAGYTLLAASGPLTPVISSPFAVTGGSAAKLVVLTEPPGSVPAGARFGFAVAAEDSFGNVASSFNGTVTVGLEQNPGGTTLGGILSATASSGVATFSGLALDAPDPGYALIASGGNLAPAISTPINVTPVYATQVVITTEPPSGVSAGSGFGLIVAAEDGSGNVDPNYQGSVTVALAINPGGATLGGTATVEFSLGIGTFSGLTLTIPAAYALEATSAGLNPAMTSSLTVHAAAATQLVVTTPPPLSLTAGNVFDLVVAAEDPYGNVDLTDTGAGHNAAITIASNPGSGSLTGTTVVAAANGVFTFGNLVLGTAGAGYTLEISSGSLTAAITKAMTVAPGPATHIALQTALPGSLVAGDSFGLVIAAEDNYSNIDPTYDGSVTLALASSPSGAMLGGTLSVPATAGVATFSGLSLTTAGSSTIAVSSGTLTGLTTNSIRVTPLPAVQLVVTTEPAGTLTAGSGFSVVVAAEDVYKNINTTFAGNVSLTLTSIPGGAMLGGTTMMAASGGVATFTGLTVTQVGVGDTISASSTALAPATTTPFTVAAAAAARLVITTQPPSSLTAGSGFGLAVAALDPYGNVNTGFTGNVILSLASGPAGGTLGGTATVAAGAGVATFTGLALDLAGSGYTVQVSSAGLAGATTSIITVSPGPVMQLGVTTQPPAAVTAASTFGLVVAAEDSFGNVIPNYAGSVVLVLSTSPGGAVLSGSLTQWPSAGVATFTGLSLNRSGSGYTLEATSGSLTPATTNGLTVTAAAATHLVVTTEPPGSVPVGSGFGLVVSAEDNDSNVDPTYNGNVALALEGSAGRATLGGTTTMAASAGVATFGGLSVNGAAGSYSLQASGGSLAGTTTNTITVTPVATRLVITTQPPGNVTAGSAFGLVVAAEDSSGDVDPNYNGNVSVTLAANPGTSSLGGTFNVNASAGVATLPGLILNKAASGYTLQLASGSLTSATTNALTVAAAPATQLVVTTQPASVVTADTEFSLAVAAEDRFGNVDPTYAGSVDVAVGANPGGAVLTGTLTLTPSSGVATFTGLSLDRAGSAYTAQVSSGSLTPVVTSAITVNAAPATHLVVTTEPPGSVTAGSPFGLVVEAEDKSGNVDPTYDGNVTLALPVNPGGATLGGTATIEASSGVATFTGLTLNKAATGDTLQVSGNLAGTTTSTLAVVNAPATQLVIITQPPGSITAGSGFGLVVAAEDGSGNVDPTYNGSITVSLAAKPGSATLGGAMTVSVSAGMAAISGLTLNKAASGYTLQVASGSLSTATTSGFAVAAAAATQLVVTTSPPADGSAGSGFGLAVTAFDQFGNVAPTFNGLVSLTLATNPGGSTLGGNTTMAASTGVATFTSLTLNKAASGYTLQAGSGSLIPATTSSITVVPGAATRLVVTTAPPGSVTAGSPFGLVVEAEDGSGNADPTYNKTVTLTLASNPGGSTLGGTSFVAASAGVATFTGATLNKAGSGTILRAASGSLTSTTTSAITVVPGAATQLVVTTSPPGSVTAANPFGLVIEAEDSSGNIDPTYNSPVTLTLASNPGGSTLGRTTMVTATAGVATWTGLTLNKADGGYVLQAASGSLASATTSAIAVVPGAATQLVVTTSPPGSVTAGNGFGLVVEAEDGAGNVDPTYNSNVALALASNPGGATLGGTASVAASGGIATFTGVTVNKADSGYTLKVASGSLTPATTSSFTVAPGAATHLVVTTSPPGSVTAASPFGLVVEAEDGSGNVDTTDNSTVTLTLASNPGGATLGGTTSVLASAGVATFTGLTLDKADSGYALEAASGSLVPATTNSVTVAAAPATQLVVTTSPPGSVTAASPFGLVVEVEDRSGNVEPNFRGSVTVTLASNPGGSTFGGTTTATASAGLATFTGLTLNKAQSGYALEAASGSLTPTTTSAIAVVPATATQFVVTAEPAGSVTAASPFGLAVAAEDGSGNVDPTYTGRVTLTLASNPGGSTFGGTTTATASAGVATFTGLTLNKAASGYALEAAGGSLNPATTSSIAVVPAAATQLVVTTEPPGGVTAASPFGLVVTAEDGSGNVDPTYNSTVTLTLASNPGGAAFGGTTAVAADNGVAKFAGLTLNKAESSYALQAASGSLTAATTSTIAVVAAPATQLVVAVEPPGTVTAGSSFSLVVEAEDGSGNIDPAYDSPVTLALASDPPGVSLGGTLMAMPKTGAVTFSGLTLNKAESGYTLEAASGSLLPATTSAITVAPGAATQLVITTEPPGSVAAGSGFGLVVAAEDGSGNVDPTYNGPVTLTFASNPGSSTLGGSTTATASAGVATFSGLILNKADTGYVLEAASGNLTPVTTSSIGAVVAPAGQLVVTPQPPPSQPVITSQPSSSINTGSGPTDVIPPLVTILGASLQPESAGKHKTSMVIVVKFSAAISAASADNLSAYSLTTMASGKKHASKPVGLAQTSYNAGGHTVTLTPARKLVLNPPLELQISGSALADTLGRGIDGGKDGQAGSTFQAMLSKGGVSIVSVATPRHRPHLAAPAVDWLLEAGLRPRD
jgi:hypothetical protein